MSIVAALIVALVAFIFCLLMLFPICVLIEESCLTLDQIRAARLKSRARKIVDYWEARVPEAGECEVCDPWICYCAEREEGETTCVD